MEMLALAITWETPHMQPGELSEGQLRDINGESVIKKMQRKWHCQNVTSWNFLKLFYWKHKKDKMLKADENLFKKWLFAKAKKRSLLHILSYKAKRRQSLCKLLLISFVFCFFLQRNKTLILNIPNDILNKSWFYYF